MMKVLCSKIRHQDLLIFRLKLFKSLISTLSKTWFNIVSTISVALVTLQTFWRLYVNEEIYSWNSEEYQEQCLSFGLNGRNGEFCNDQKGQKRPSLALNTDQWLWKKSKTEDTLPWRDECLKFYPKKEF